MEYLNKTIKQNCEDYCAFYYRGLCYQNLNDYFNAIENYDACLKLKPSYYLAMYHKGVMLCDSLHKISDALKCFEQLIKIKPSVADGYFYKAKCLILMGMKDKNEEILQLLEEAIRKDSGHLEAMYYKGVYLLEMRDFGSALDMFNYILEIRKKDARSFYRKGICLTKMGEYDEGKECLDKAVALDKDIIKKIMDEY